MATVVSNATQLRTAIQAAVNGEQIQLNTSPETLTTYASVTTLAKFPCFTPLTMTGGYTIDGISRSFTTLTNTRVYQENIDGPYAPSTVKNLKLNYSAANDAIFRATKGTYSLEMLNITGTHGGWAGNGGVYISLNASPSYSTSNVNFTLKNSLINLNPNSQTNGTASFMQSWNNAGNVLLDSNQFNEAGYNRGSFHFASMYPGGAAGATIGRYRVQGNTFTGVGTTKSNGNRLENVNAILIDNIFQSGSYLDLAGSSAATTVINNTFNTISGGPGIRFTQKSSSLASLNTTGLTFSGNTFNGYGLAVVNNDSGVAPASSVVATSGGMNYVNTGTLSMALITKFYAGGSVADTITDLSGSDVWMSGGSGNDTITSGNGFDYIIGGADNDTISTGLGSDTILYYETTEGVDTITDFTSGTDSLAFRGNTSGGSTFFNFAPNTTLTAGTNFITSGTPPTTGPTFIFIGGVLSYDADGSGGGGAVSIANFTGTSTAVNASDIKFF